MSELKWQGVPLDVVPGQWHTVIVPTVRAVLLDEAKNPIIGQECVITGPNGFRARARTDARGRVSIPAPVGDEYQISFVHLDQEVWAAAPEQATSEASEGQATEAST